MSNGNSHPYPLDESISNFKGCRVVISILFKFYKHFLQANSAEPDQTPLFAASDLVLHCLPISHKRDAMLIWVKIIEKTTLLK